MRKGNNRLENPMGSRVPLFAFRDSQRAGEQTQKQIYQPDKNLSSYPAVVTIPRQSRGPSIVSRSKRLVGSLTRPQVHEPPKGGSSAP